MSIKIKEREAAEVRIETRKKIRRLIRMLFPNMRFMRQPFVMLDHYGDVFTAMIELQKAGHFRIPGDKKLREKCKIATEIALLMLHPRAETYITTYPKSSRLCLITHSIGPWYSMPFTRLREIRSEVIAMQAEGFPLD